MGLYTSYDTSEYYDTLSTKKVEQKKQDVVTPVNIPPEVRKSLYDKSQDVIDKKKRYNGIDFRNKYRVGQRIAVQGPNGNTRTSKGVIAEIVAENLMYVAMEDSYKDVNEQWLIDFVTDKDRILIL